MVVEWLCPGLRPTRSNRPRLLHCKVILLDEHELLQDVLVSLAKSIVLFYFSQNRSNRIEIHMNGAVSSYRNSRTSY